MSIHVVEKDRASRYDPGARSLVPVKQAAPGEQAPDFRVQVTGPSAFAAAPAVLVFSVDLARFPDRAGTEMRLPWAHAECGAIGQNVALACAELDLGTVFSSLGRVAEVRAFLGLGETEHPAYLMPIGKPK